MNRLSAVPNHVRTGLILLLPLVLVLGGAGCAGGGGGGSTPDSSPTLNARDMQPDVDTDKIERLVDQKIKKRLKPSEDSPGPYMISFFSLPDRSASFEHRKKPDRFKQAPNRKSDKKQFVYMILLSKEWAYKRLPIREPFTRVTNPGIKVINDEAMNWFLDFLKKNNFLKFPKAGKMSAGDARKIARGEIIITIWKGTNNYRRVYFDRELKARMWNMLRSSRERARKMFKDRNNIIFSYQALFNKAPNRQASVRVSGFNWKRRLKQLGHKHRLQNTTNVEGMLKRAEKRIEQKRYEEARNILKEVIEISSGTTYYHRAIALLQDLREKQAGEQKKGN